jgi:hypothetical protein
MHDLVQRMDLLLLMLTPGFSDDHSHSSLCQAGCQEQASNACPHDMHIGFEGDVIVPANQVPDHRSSPTSPSVSSEPLVQAGADDNRSVWVPPQRAGRDFRRIHGVAPFSHGGFISVRDVHYPLIASRDSERLRDRQDSRSARRYRFG